MQAISHEYIFYYVFSYIDCDQLQFWLFTNKQFYRALKSYFHDHTKRLSLKDFCLKTQYSIPSLFKSFNSAQEVGLDSFSSNLVSVRLALQLQKLTVMSLYIKSLEVARGLLHFPQFHKLKELKFIVRVEFIPRTNETSSVLMKVASKCKQLDKFTLYYEIERQFYNSKFRLPLTGIAKCKAIELSQPSLQSFISHSSQFTNLRILKLQIWFPSYNGHQQHSCKNFHKFIQNLDLLEFSLFVKLPSDDPDQNHLLLFQDSLIYALSRSSNLQLLQLMLYSAYGRYRVDSLSEIALCTLFENIIALQRVKLASFALNNSTYLPTLLAAQGQTLKSLQLQYCKLVYEDIEAINEYHFSDCPLQELCIKGCGGIRNQSLLSILSVHKQLTTLGLSCLKEVDTNVIELISELKLLQSLSLNKLSSKGDLKLLHTIASLKNLHTLKLNNIALPHFYDFFSQNGSSLRYLKVLHLNQSKIKDRDLDVVDNTCIRLIRLSVSNNEGVTIERLEEMVRRNQRLNIVCDGLILSIDSLG